ncbi:hypothetical protein Pelo_9534 [Pelomyxa schiedti]|nr:hypothetical protein Pelo_9534 [Pelomyxa schiedti]
MQPQLIPIPEPIPEPIPRITPRPIPRPASRSPDVERIAVRERQLEEKERQLRQREEDCARRERNLTIQEQRNCMPSGGSGVAFSELNSVHGVITQLQPQLITAAAEVMRFEECLTRVREQCQTLRERTGALESELLKLTELRDILVKERNDLEMKCNQVLGKAFTSQSSGSDIRKASDKIKSLTQKVLETLPHDGTPPLVPSKDSGNLIASTPTPFEKLVCLDAPPFSLKSITDNLMLLQSCKLNECPKLLDKYSLLAKECSDLSSQIQFLEKERSDLFLSCKELDQSYQQSYLFHNALEGNAEFIGLPNVRQKLCALLPEAQQQLMGLLGQAGSSCPPGSTASPSPAPSCGTLPVSNEILCIVCDERPRNVRLHPCGHGVLCSECAAFLRKCPFCRSPIQDKQKLFL